MCKNEAESSLASFLESQHQEQATRKTAKDKHAFLVTLGMRGFVGELEWVTRSSATFVKQRSAQNMQVKQGKICFLEELIMLRTPKKEL